MDDMPHYPVAVSLATNGESGDLPIYVAARSYSTAATGTASMELTAVKWEDDMAVLAEDRADHSCTPAADGRRACRGAGRRSAAYSPQSAAKWLERFDVAWGHLEATGEGATIEGAIAIAVQGQAPDTMSKMRKALQKWQLRRRTMGVAKFFASFRASGYRPWFPAAEKKLIEAFDRRRAKGLAITELWMVINMRRFIKQHEPNSERKTEVLHDASRPTHGWVRKFVARHGLVPRRKTNTKSKPLQMRLLLIQNHLRRLRLEVLTPRAGSATPMQCGTFGRFRLENRFNVDQVPLPFIVAMKSTWEHAGQDRVWLKHYGNGLDKRQASLQVCVRGRGTQCVTLAIIFRGAEDGDYYDKSHGGRQPERDRYDARVHVYFQANAWASPSFSNKWIAKTFLPCLRAAGIEDESLLFADNLGGQSAVEGQFKTIAHAGKCFVWNYPPGCTDEVQVVDAGIGQELVRQIGKEQMQWLDATTDGVMNVDLWDTPGALDASDRRVLLTVWAARAQEVVFARNRFIERAWERTGSALALHPNVGGLDLDARISLEGYDKLQPELGAFHFMDVPLSEPQEPAPKRRRARSGAGTYAYGVELSASTYSTEAVEVADVRVRDLALEMEDTLDQEDLPSLLARLHLFIDADTALDPSPAEGDYVFLNMGAGWSLSRFYRPPLQTQRDRGATHRVHVVPGDACACATLREDNRARSATAQDLNSCVWALPRVPIP